MRYVAACITGLGLVAFLGVLGSCSDSSQNSTAGNIDIVLKSTGLARGESPRAGTDCSVTYESTTTNGKCYSPVEVSGIFNAGSLSSTGGGAPVRILGGGNDHGLTAVFKKAAFNLKSQPTIDGEDNIQDGGGTYNLVTLSVQAIETTFVADTGNQYYHVRIPFTTTPPSANSTFSSCGLGGGLTEADSLGTLFGSVTAYPGDILVCIKATSTATCTDSEYQWVDGSGNLQSTRPGSPKRLAGSQLMVADSCTSSGAHPEITWGKASVDISLGSSVSVSAAISEGVKSYTTGGSTGTALTMTLDISTSNSIFVPTTAIAGDLNSVNQATVLGSIDQILLKPIYVGNNKSSSASTGDGMLSATASLSVQ